METGRIYIYIYIYIVATAADLTDSESMGDQSLSSPNNAQKL
jgi:hypothetical protein